MTNIVERLRASVTKGHEPTDEDAIEAADEIERLRAWNYRLLQRADAAQTEIERLNAAYEQLRETYLQTAEQLAEATAEVDRLRVLWENSPLAAR